MTGNPRGRVALALFGLAAALLSVEVGLRVVLGNRVDYDRAYRQYDPMVGHVHAPNLDLRIPFPEHPRGYFDLVTDAHGLREDATVPFERAAGAARILVLGDSHTDATVFNAESYPNVLEAGLAGLGIPAEVLNAGVSDYDPLQELLWFHYYGRRYRPDVVIIGIYVGNDLLEMTGFDELALVDGELMIDGEPHAPVPQPLGERLGEWMSGSYLYSILRWTVFPAITAEQDPGGHNSAFRACRGCYWQSLNQAARFAAGEIEIEAALDRFANVLAVLQQDVEAAGGRLVVLLIPTRRQVEPVAGYAETAEILGMSGPDLAFDDRALSELEAIAAGLGLQVENPLQALSSAAAAGAGMYYAADWHLNPNGHAVVAGLLLEPAADLLTVAAGGPH